MRKIHNPVRLLELTTLLNGLVFLRWARCWSPPGQGLAAGGFPPPEG